MNPLKVILASASPRRRQFLAALGLAHTAAAADIDESPLPGEEAEDLAARLARSKALAVADNLRPDQCPALVIGADTVVALDGLLLGKPLDAAEATAMLAALAGRVHQVHSALAVVYVAQKTEFLPAAVKNSVFVNTTQVTMRAYSDDEIAAYVATGDPFDKAGGYAIQHRGFDPVAQLDGCPAGVMGLPAAELVALLARFGVTIDCSLAAVCCALTGLACCKLSVNSNQ